MELGPGAPTLPLQGRGDMAMGQNPVPLVNIPIPIKIGSRMGGAPTPNLGSHWC